MQNMILPSTKREWGLLFVYLIPFVPYVYKLISPFFIILGLSSFTIIINPTILWVGLYLSYNRAFNAIKLKDLLFYILIVSGIVCSVAFHPQTTDFFNENFLSFILYVLPCYFIGVLICYDADKKILRLVSYIGVIVILFWQVCLLLRLVEVSETDSGTLGEQMQQAYMLLFPIFYLFIQESKTKFDILLLIISIAVLLMMGTRGPIMLLGIFIPTYLLLFKKFRRHNIFWKIIVVILGIIFVANVKWISLLMIPVVASLGFTTRVFDSIVNSSFSYEESSGRDEIYAKIVDFIGSQEGICGLGWGGDRLITIDNMWAHNFELEVLAQFGWLVGGFLLFVLVLIIIVCLYRTRRTETQAFLLVMIFVGLMELQFSSTYISHQLLFVLIGYCVSILRNANMTTKL